jgi:hypothetical protein
MIGVEAERVLVGAMVLKGKAGIHLWKGPACSVKKLVLYLENSEVHCKT